MNIKYFLLIPFIIINLYSQQNRYDFEQFSIIMDGKTMVVNEDDKIIWTYIFQNPTEYIIDLDGDDLHEFLVVDQFDEKGRMNHYFYVFNTVDTFFLVDSVNSGIIEPYIIYSEELEDYIIVAGNHLFFEISENPEYLPLDCYKYETGELLQVNDEIYEIFLDENVDLLEIIDRYFQVNEDNCSSTKNIKSLLSSAYANYINAGEPTLASQLISNYYYCEDRQEFQNKINELLQIQ
jgi:hypothetical protein